MCSTDYVGHGFTTPSEKHFSFFLIRLALVLENLV